MKIITANRLWAGALLLIMAFALSLRLTGISHGLERGYVYHPDTPKQIAAVQEYLEGRYYTVKGNLNYDGYPFFNSRLMELGIRLRAVFGGTMTPNRLDLFRETRILNATLSTLAVALVFLIVIGVSGSRPAALIAALLQAISPVDVVACHYAMGDTTAAFFATVTVLFAVWIYKYGNFRSYVLAGIALTCAFASKYHGAAAGISIAAAHLLRYPPKKFLSKASLYRIAATSSAALISLPIAIPSMFSKPIKTIENILAFLKYTSNFKMTDELMQKNLVERWIFGVSHNYPDFAYMLTGGLLILILVGTVLLVRKNRAVLIIALLPAIYMFVGLPFKPLSHIEYHTLVSPCLFALAAMSLANIPNIVPSRLRNPSITATTAILTVICGLLLTRSIYHNFYFILPDTRQLATDWVYHNLPDSFQVAAGHYSYIGVPPTVPRDKKQGVVMLSSSFRPHHAPKTYSTKFGFDLHDTRLELFRNPAITLYIHRSPWLQPNWQHPTLQTLPYGENSGIASISSPVFNRNPLQHTVSIKNELNLLVLAPTNLTSATIILQTADKPAEINGSFGQQSFSCRIPANSARSIRLQNLHYRLPRIISAKLYPWKITTQNGPLMATLAISPEQEAAALTRAGLMTQAQKTFAAIPSTSNKALNLMRSIANNNPKPPPFDIFRTCGIDPKLLETAPAVYITKSDWQKISDGDYKTNPIFVAPGSYGIKNATNITAFAAGNNKELGHTTLFNVPFGTAAIELHSNNPQALNINVNPAATLQFYRQ